MKASSLELNPPQDEVVARGLLTSGFNCVLQMPTGAGKTWLAEQAIATTLEAGHRAIYITPLRALANELVEKWRQRFSKVEVGVFTGEYGQRQDYPVPFERARLLVMTPERLDACTRQWRSHWGWLPQVNLLVVDELHLLGDPGRGPRLEGALMRVCRLNPFLQVIGLSATLGNRAELADWLNGVHYGSEWRPIPIQWSLARYQRATDKPRILQEEVQRCLASGGQSLVFVQSRRRAETLSADLREAGIPAGHHHAGLDSAARRTQENEYRAGSLRVLVSTGTLEMGLNLPARQVVLYDLQNFDGRDFSPLSVNTVWQRAGRAGRRGLDTQGEVVLLAPTWDRTASRYEVGRFEPVVSGLGRAHALAEQVLAEVSSGLARTRAQLTRNLQRSLAFHQQRLPALDRSVNEMIDAGMLVEVTDEGARAPALKPTRLGRIAVRQMLAPSTVVSLAQALRKDTAGRLTFFDLLLLCIGTSDCEPLVPADFEELDDLNARLSRERSTLLVGTQAEVLERLGLKGRQLLTAIKTALIARDWTRLGSSEAVGDQFGCYPFEVRRLSESLERILTAAVAIVAPEKETAQPEVYVDDDLPVHERVQALAAMVANGVDEQAVTLTYLTGLGGTLARRLHDAGIEDIEDLALAEPEQVAAVRGVSPTRATQWIEQATNLIRTRSAHCLLDTGASIKTHSSAWPTGVDPYRLRRAIELNVRTEGGDFTVSGGLEPHRVRVTGTSLACDCADFGKGAVCKHVLAARLHSKDPEIASLVESLSPTNAGNELDLSQLWFDGGAR